MTDFPPFEASLLPEGARARCGRRTRRDPAGAACGKGLGKRPAAKARWRCASVELMSLPMQLWLSYALYAVIGYMDSVAGEHPSGVVDMVSVAGEHASGVVDMVSVAGDDRRQLLLPVSDN